MYFESAWKRLAFDDNNVTNASQSQTEKVPPNSERERERERERARSSRKSLEKVKKQI